MGEILDKNLKTYNMAMNYIEHGYSVIPLKSKDKKPDIESWKEYQSRLATPAEITKWFLESDDRNIGIVTGAISGIVVVDVDSREALRIATDKGIPTCPTVQTGKGYHFYFKYRDGVRNFQKRDDFPGIDLRGNGGYVVCPPSFHASGKQYLWEGFDRPLPELPAWVLANKDNPKKPIVELYQGVTEGSRNDTLARLAGVWVRSLPLHEAIEMAYAWNSRNFPPLPENEIERTVNSIYETHQRSKQKNPIKAVISQPAQDNFFSSIISLDELLTMEIPERSRLLPWLPEGGLIMVYGPCGIGKTYFALELGKALACGSPFLKWQTVHPTGILFIDGEMAFSDVRKRFVNLLNGKPKAPVFFLSHEFFYTNTEKDLNLASPDIQCSIQKYIESHRDIGVIVFDNLSCLLPGVKEDKRDDWTTQVLPFLLWLRRRGVSVVLLHHSGKGGDQRGTSSREDALDTVIRLEKIPSAGKESAEFIIRFVKSRGAYGDDVSDIEAKLTLIDGVSTWTWRPVKESTEDRLLALIAEGIDNVTDAAEELGVTKGMVSRIKKKLQDEGKLQPGKELKIK